MSFTNSIEIDEVYSFKLCTGEEIVAKVVHVESDWVQVYRPLTIMLGQGGVQMMPSLVTAHPDKNMTLNNNSIVLFSVPRHEVFESYIEGTTGIKPVTNKILMG